MTWVTQVATPGSARQISRVADAPITKVGKYELTDLLGQGAMGVVYRALDPMLHRYVALKLMSQGIAADAALRDRFMREARSAGSLQHPNIITIFDFGEAEGHLYIAMEYVEGADLSELIERQDPLPLPGKLDILIDVLRALDYAHERRVVHRDIKPANIRVSVDGRAKLMDFGIARLESSELTKSGMLIGTPHYMSPEQVSGGEISGSTDVFAMGVVMYEFLTYERAFGGDSLTAVLYQVVSAEPPRFSDVAPTVPPQLQAIVQKAMAKDPAARYSSAGAMAQDLANVRTALSGGAPVTINARRTPLLGTRMPTPIPSGPVPSTRAEPARTASEPRPPAEPATAVSNGRRSNVPIAIAAVIAVVTLILLGGIWRELRRNDTTLASAPAAAPPQVAAAPAARTDSALPPPAVAATPRPADQVSRESAPPQGRAAPATEARRPEAPAVSAPVPPTAPTVPQPAPQQAPEVTPPVVTAPPPTAPPVQPPAALPAAPVDHRPAIEALIASYARAIESRSVDQIRRVYPGMTEDQATGWRQFFSSVRSVRTRLSVNDLDIDGSRATMSVAGSHEYSTGGARAENQAVTFRASAVLENGIWRLQQIR